MNRKSQKESGSGLVGLLSWSLDTHRKDKKTLCRIAGKKKEEEAGTS